MEQQTKNCPYCGEEILAVAKKCKHCGEWLETKEEKETASAISAEVTPKTEEIPVNQQAAEQPTSKVAPVESGYASNNVKLILGAITALFMILSICFFVFPPEIEFDYIFGTFPYGLIFLFLSLFALLFFIISFDEHRTSRVYLDSNGDLDIETPREYEPLSVSPVSKVIGRANIYGQKNLSLFKYYDGRVLIRNSKGHEVEGALSDLTYTYKMDKNKMTDEWYVYQFIITDGNGNKVQFNEHSSLFTEEEYADIEMLLSLAGTVKEAKISKFTRKADSIASTINDLDFSKLKSATIELTGTTATKKITDIAGLIAKKQIFDRLSDKKKSLFAKIKEYSICILFAIFVIAIIWVNVENAMNVYGSSSSENTEYNIEQVNSNSENSSENDSSDENDIITDYDRYADSDEGFIVEFEGAIGKYSIQMALNFLDLDNYESCGVAGQYRYTETGEGGVIDLYGEKKGDNLVLKEYSEGNLTGTFSGTLDIYGNLASFEYTGTFTTPQGKSFEFSLRSN